MRERPFLFNFGLLAGMLLLSAVQVFSKEQLVLPENESVPPMGEDVTIPTPGEKRRLAPLEQEEGWTGGLVTPSNPKSGELFSGQMPRLELPSETEGQAAVEQKGIDWALSPITLEQTGGMGALESRLAPEGIRFRLGGLELRPVWQLGIEYNDNLFQSAFVKEADMVTTFMPGLVGGLGDAVEKKEDYLLLGYAPHFLFHEKRSDLDVLNQAIRLEGFHVLNRVSLGGKWFWKKTTQTARDTGQRIQELTQSGEVRAEVQVSERSKAEASLALTSTSSANGFRTNETVGHLWGIRRRSEKGEVGFGGALGELNSSTGSAAVFAQCLGRLRWMASQKLTLQAILGEDLRQFESKIPVKETPILDLGAYWTPQPRTNLQVSLRRDISNSASGEDLHYVSNGIYGNVRQRIGRSLQAELSGGCEKFEYYSSARHPLDSNLSQRVDVSRTARVGLYYLIPPTSLVSVYYLWKDNRSSLDRFGFENNQIGLECKTNF